MSRENDGLPMLPPWLAEGEVSDTAYEPAPVQNLPQDEVIPKAKGGRGLFGKRPSRKQTAAEQAPLVLTAWNRTDFHAESSLI
ncbi:hypothetical protein [Nocardia sp. NPDC004722]